MTISPEDRAFFGNAVLETVLPEPSNATLPEVLHNGGEPGIGDDTSILSIKQREHLFFDERLTVFVVLRIARGSEIALKKYLPRLAIKLDVHVIDAQQLHQNRSDKHEGTERELIFSGAVKTSHDPFIAVDESGGYAEGENPWIVVIWDTEAVLNRPRTRLAKRAVAFSASASLTAVKGADHGFSDDDLPALEAAPANIVDALATIPALRNQTAYGPASGIWDVRPGPKLDLDTLQIGQRTTKQVPISPAVSARLRCSRLHANLPRPAMLASLDFEVTPSAYFDVFLNKASISLASDGHIELLSPLKMPIKCRSRDIVSILYKIEPPKDPLQNPFSGPSTQSHPVGLLDMLLESTLAISPNCQPSITMCWRSTMDFFVSQPPQRLHRPTRPATMFFPPSAKTKASTDPEIRTSSSGLNTPLSVSRPTGNQFTGMTTTTSPPSSGLTISFTVPDTVCRGHTFNMTVLLINHSPRALRLVLIPLARRPPTSPSPSSLSITATSSVTAINTSSSNKPDLQRRSSTQPDSTTATTTTTTATTKVAPAVLEEPTPHTSLYQQQPQQQQHYSQQPSTSAEADLIPLTTDLRLGPLPVGSCHESQIKMVALKAGVCRLEAVRVVDLEREREGGVGSGVVVVRGEVLPEVVVAGVGGGGG